jgi:flagellar export protein FliJ
MARRFRFPLQTLLKVRQLREREAKRKVAAQYAEIARLDQLDQAARREIAARQGDLLDHQRHRYLDPRDLSRGWSWIAHLRSAMAQRQAMRAEMVKELERLQAEFRAARQQTRIIEKLRERRWDEYSRDRRRREQAAADEVAQQLHLLKRIPEKTWPRRPGHATRPTVASDPRVGRPM